MFNVYATQISDSIDIDAFQTAYSAELLHFNHHELFYEVDTEVYVSVFRYGVVCFFNFSESRINAFIQLISQNCVYFYDSELVKRYQIEPVQDNLVIGFNKIQLTYLDIETIRVIMINLSHSVALDCYHENAKVMLAQTGKFTYTLEKSGQLTISDVKLKKFIGRTHNLKNQIIENLHLLDLFSSETKDDYIMLVDSGMKEALFIDKKSNNIYEELNIIKEHLEFFNDLMINKSNTKLSVIIIILLAVFVIDIIVERFFLN
jgi:required for meiotic nuclear division protein 1